MLLLLHKKYNKQNACACLCAKALSGLAHASALAAAA
jgi:hypothetical protein